MSSFLRCGGGMLWRASGARCRLSLSSVTVHKTIAVRRTPVVPSLSFYCHSFLRSHFSSARLSPLLPLTTNEPRLAKSETELLARLEPLADLWGLEDDALAAFLSSNKDSSSSSSSSSSFNSLTKDQLLSVLSLPLPGEPGWEEGPSSAVLRALYTLANVVCTRHHQDKVRQSLRAELMGASVSESG